MSQKKYIVSLTNAEIKDLETVVRTEKHAARKVRNARILLQAHAGKTDLDSLLNCHRLLRGPRRSSQLDDATVSRSSSGSKGGGLD
jgi:hypothetical protein